MNEVHELDLRQIAEIRMALWYANGTAHGTASHNQLMLIARLAGELGFRLEGEILCRIIDHAPLLAYPLGSVAEFTQRAWEARE